MRTPSRSLAGTVVTMSIAVGLLAGLVVPAAAQTEEGSRPSRGCQDPLAQPGDYEGLNDYDGADQKYFVIVPESYADIAPAPLDLILGSGGGDPDLNYAGRREYFEDEPVLIVIVGAQTGKQRSPSTLLELVDQLAADYCIDLRRVHVSGSSSSAGAAANLACEGSDRIASFFDGMGSFAVRFCEPDHGVPLMAITGDTDRTAVTRSVAAWVEHNGCDPEPLVEDLGSGISRKTYQGCEADVLFYDIAGLGHKAVVHECVGPFSESYCAEYAELDEIDESQRFFAEHPLPE